MITTASGLQHEDTVAGQGDEARAGQVVEVQGLRIHVKAAACPREES